MTLKQFFDLLLPPVFEKAWKRWRRYWQRKKGMLFDGDDTLFKNNVIHARVYGEYGMGQSTQWVFDNTKARMVSVELSAMYLDAFKKNNQTTDRCELIWVDVGPLGHWGRPQSYAYHQYFSRYVESLWQSTHRPDFVLVDGRFRVACFLCSLLQADPGTRILFDDFDRVQYHVVEEVVLPIERTVRQALFVVPDTFDRVKAQQLLDRFVYVMD